MLREDAAVAPDTPPVLPMGLLESILPVLGLIGGVWQQVARVVLALPVVGRWVDITACAVVAGVASIGYGARACVAGARKRPVGVLKLYEFEGCPYCKRVREAISALDLDVLVLPCPRETLRRYGQASVGRYRVEAKRVGGKAQFPYLVDEGSGVSMYGSDAICAYLWREYGGGAGQPAVAAFINKPLVFGLRCVLNFACRPLPEHGILRAPSHAPRQPLVLYANEASAHCKRVRELLSCLELPFHLRSAAGAGGGAIPRLEDPNTGEVLTTSDAIMAHIRGLYQAGPCCEAEGSLRHYTVDGKTS